jgi:hypothetical protein
MKRILVVDDSVTLRNGPITPQGLTSYSPPSCTINATVSTGVTLYCNYCGTTCE